MYYRSYGKQPPKRGVLQTCPNGAKARCKEEMEAQDTGIARGAQLNEDHQPPHTENTIPLVCQTCQTCFINFSVQYSTHILVEQVKQIAVFCLSINLHLGWSEKLHEGNGCTSMETTLKPPS